MAAVICAAVFTLACSLDGRELGIASSASVSDAGNTLSGGGSVLQVASRTFNFGAVAIGGDATGVLVVGNVGDLLDAAATYVRPDGQLVGTGAQIAAGTMPGVPWIAANGSTVNIEFAWSGATDPGTLPSAADTCSDWRDTGSTAMIGLIGISDVRAFRGAVDRASCSDQTRRLYCIEP
jgi:hypothetical protein